MATDKSILQTSDEMDNANAIISIAASICRMFLTLTAFISRLEMLSATSAWSRPLTDEGVDEGLGALSTH
jgi:hypothetical protein